MEFRAGSAAKTGQVRLSAYAVVLIIVAISVLTSGPSWRLVLSGGVPLLVVLLLDRFVLSKLPKPGDVLVSLLPDAIESRLFSTTQKRYLWSDIAEVGAESIAGTTALQLQLKPSPDRPNRRAFLNGVNPARPYLALNAFTPDEQERLLDAVRLRLRGGASAFDSQPQRPAVPNELTMTRQWQEQLTALAPKVWVCWALIATNVLVWLATAAMGVGWMTGDAEKLYAFGGNTASAVQAGEWWRLLSATFLHADAMHLIFNMIGLYVVGTLVERIFGRSSFLLIYLSCGLAGSVASLYFGAQTTVSVGASGAVFGIAGALLAVVYQHRQSLPRLFNRQILGGMAIFVGYSLLMGFSKAGVDNAAHVAGLATGALVGLLLPPRFDAEHHASAVMDRAILVAGLVAIVLSWAALRAPTAKVDVAARIEIKHAIPTVALAFDQAVKALQQDQQAVKNGQMTDREADDRSRSVHAPRMQTVIDQMKALPIDAASPAADFMGDLLGLAQALHELLAMDSVPVNGKMQPTNMARAKELEAQVKTFNDRLLKRAERNKKASGSRAS